MMRFTAVDWAAVTRIAGACPLVLDLGSRLLPRTPGHGLSFLSPVVTLACVRNHADLASGTGEGIYVSYLFTWLWIADAVWWWTAPASYASRSRWIDRLLHPFMLFITFNGMVVFETGLIRWAGLIMFAGLSAAWLLARGIPRPQHA